MYRLLLFIQFVSFSTGLKVFCQEMPGTNGLQATDTPVIFAPGIISDESGNRDMAISLSGDEIFFTLQFLGGRAFSTILYTKKINGKWTDPEVAPFCGKYNDLEPAFSPDGQTLYFVSNRPLGDSLGPVKDYDIWFVKKETNGWGKPANAGFPVNTSNDEFYPSVSKKGNIYFTRNMGKADEDIVMCTWLNNRYDTAIALPSAVNSMGAEFNAFVDPDEGFIIFTGYKRPGNYGSGDLFISYKNESGEWMAAENLGEKINGPGLTYCPYITPDKKYFFFTSSRGGARAPFRSRQSMADLKKLMNSPFNGWDNIYWMKAEMITGNKKTR